MSLCLLSQNYLVVLWTEIKWTNPLASWLQINGGWNSPCTVHILCRELQSTSSLHERWRAINIFLKPYHSSACNISPSALLPCIRLSLWQLYWDGLIRAYSELLIFPLWAWWFPPFLTPSPAPFWQDPLCHLDSCLLLSSTDILASWSLLSSASITSWRARHSQKIWTSCWPTQPVLHRTIHPHLCLWQSAAPKLFPSSWNDSSRTWLWKWFF